MCVSHPKSTLNFYRKFYIEITTTIPTCSVCLMILLEPYCYFALENRVHAFIRYYVVDFGFSSIFFFAEFSYCCCCCYRSFMSLSVFECVYMCVNFINCYSMNRIEICAHIEISYKVMALLRIT